MLDTLFINTLLFGLIAFTLVTFAFLLATVRHNHTITDVWYAPFVALSAIGTIIISNTMTPLAVLIATLMTIWALRLGFRAYIKQRRYGHATSSVTWRQRWIMPHTDWPLARVYIRSYIAQMAMMILLGMPFLIALSAGKVLGSWYTVIGITLVCIGLLYETIADWQLDHFLMKKYHHSFENIPLSQPLLSTGLFRYSRHPNYFGEIMLWSGLITIAWPVPYGYLGLMSLALVLYILRITSVRMERSLLLRYPEAYQAYQQTTAYVIPRRARKQQ